MTHKRQKRVLVALGWYDYRLHRGIEKFAQEHRWHLSSNFAREKVIPWGWEGDGILAWLGAAGTGLDVFWYTGPFWILIGIPIIDTLVGTNQPQLQGLVSHLDSVLGVLSDHQLDLAQGVSSLASAVTGFSSVGYSGPQDTPNSWANIYTNLVGTSGVYSVLGACGALDDVLDEALGPDPLPCDERSGPLASDAAAPAASTSTATTPATSATPATTATTVPPTGTGAPAPAVDPVVPPATGTTPSAGGSSGSLGALLRPLLGGSG